MITPAGGSDRIDQRAGASNDPSIVGPVKGQAAVAAGNADTAAAAVEMLRAGGNAFDAAVAAGFAAAVTEPALTSLGGGGFLITARPAAEPEIFDFFVNSPGLGAAPPTALAEFVPVTIRFPGADQVFQAGWSSVAVPGCLDGYLEVHRQLGRLSLADVIAPAQRLATDGTVVDPAQARLLTLLAQILTLAPEGREIFTSRGELLAAGDRMRNETLGAFLADLAAGRTGGFTDPSLATAVHKTMAHEGGLVTAEDLAAYDVVRRAPLRASYRGAEIHLNPPPSFGGTIVAEALAELAGGESIDDSPGALVRLATVLVGLSERHARQPQPQAVRGTTHVSVVDHDGNVAAMTTSNGSCSGQFVPGTGIQLNNMLGEADLHPGGFHSAPPATRIGSMMSPLVVRAADGATVGAGSGGSERIRSALTCLLVQLLDRRLDLDAAVAAPRLHWDGAVLQVEPGPGEAALASLAAGWQVNEWPCRDVYFGGAHCVARLPDGTALAAGDPRRGGAGVVLAIP